MFNFSDIELWLTWSFFFLLLFQNFQGTESPDEPVTFGFPPLKKDVFVKKDTKSIEEDLKEAFNDRLDHPAAPVFKNDPLYLAEWYFPPLKKDVAKLWNSIISYSIDFIFYLLYKLKGYLNNFL